MTSGGYKHVFGEQHQSNAYMVRLKNHETSNVESRSAKLMKLDGVKGIVQNTT
nr:peptide ABC transporter permease [Bifidobacterium longum]